MAQIIVPEKRQEKKRDLVDTILTGLQAASYFTNIQNARAELADRPGIKARQEQIDKQNFVQNFVEVPDETQGAVSLDVPGENRKGLFLPTNQIASTAQVSSNKAKELQDQSAKKYEILTNVSKELNQDKEFQSARNKVLESTQLARLGEEALKGNQSAFEQMKVVIAKLNQGGVLSDQDLQAAGGAQSYNEKIQRFFTTKVVGDVRQEDVEDLLDVAKVSRQSGLETAQIIRNGFLDRVENRLKNSGVKDIDRKILEQEISQTNDLFAAQDNSKIPNRTTAIRRGLSTPQKKNTPTKPARDINEQLEEFDKLNGGQ